MALLPHILNELSDPFHNSFGLGLFSGDSWDPLPSYRRYMNSSLRDLDGVDRNTHIGKDGFQVSMDVQHFAPNEISVKTVDNSIVVEGKHEERQDDHGYISRQFTRRYELPKEFNTQDVVTTLSSDGILTVKAPPAAALQDNVRHVQIQQTGPARLNIKNKEEPKDKKAK